MRKITPFKALSQVC
uniref:Uncharacterized protein n=1 Tax=Rhizophora mucronata TaxID=61149 RepID=A0A2P2KWY0_RHIMU